MNPFDCTDIKATLSALVDDEADTETRHRAERHLASCAPCRALISEAEGLDDLIAMDAAALMPKRLPEGFMDGVLSRTVYARAYERAGWNWTTWLGWVAAAACLGLAVSLWFLNPRTLSLSGGGIGGGGTGSGGDVALSHDVLTPRSWTFDGYVSREDLSVRPVSYILDDDTRQAIDEQLALAQPTSAALEQISQRPTLSADDADTLRATANVLDMLAASDLTTFADVERVREIAVYDDLAQRLVSVRGHLKPADRAAVMAAESILLRIINGPMDLDDLRMLHETVASMNLAKQLGTITEARDTSTSL